MKQVKRAKPVDEVIFRPPIVGPSGASLVSYVWQWTEAPDDRSSTGARRISDWSKAEASDETGRDLVHQFDAYDPDGKRLMVSREGALRLLGYSERTEGAKSIKSVGQAAITLARQMHELSEKEKVREEIKQIDAEVDLLPVPPTVVVRFDRDSGQWNRERHRWIVEDSGVRVATFFGAEPTSRQVRDAWRRSEKDNRIWKRFGRTARIEEDIRELKARIERQMKRVDQLTEKHAQIAKASHPSPPPQPKVVASHSPAFSPLPKAPPIVERGGQMRLFNPKKSIPNRTTAKSDPKQVDLAEAILRKNGITLREACRRPRPAGPPKPARPAAEPPVDLASVEAYVRRETVLNGWPSNREAAATIAARMAAKPTSWTYARLVSGEVFVEQAGSKRAIETKAKSLRAPRGVDLFLAPLRSGDDDADAATVRAVKQASEPQAAHAYIKAADGERVPVYLGADTTVLIPDAKGMDTLPCRYALVPVDDVLTSHNPFSFSPRKGYDPALQERDYQGDTAEQAKVIRQAQQFRVELVASSDPTATGGPPIIDDKGRVLGGNSRAMTIARVAKENAGGYRAALEHSLQSHCSVFGLPSSLPKGGWMLVRVVTGDYDAKTISRRLNRGFTQQLGESARAVSYAKMLPDAVFEEIAGLLEEETLAGTIRKASTEIAKALRDAGFISPQEINAMLTRDGKLTASSVALLEQSILGALVPDVSLLDRMPGRLHDVLGRIAPIVIVLERESKFQKWSIADAIRAAVPYAVRTLEMSAPERKSYLQNASLMGDPAREAVEASADAAAAFVWLLRAAKAPSKAATAMLAYYRAAASDASKEGGLFAFEPLNPASERERLLRWASPSQVRAAGGPFRYILDAAQSDTLEKPLDVRTMNRRRPSRNNARVAQGMAAVVRWSMESRPRRAERTHRRIR